MFPFLLLYVFTVAILHTYVVSDAACDDSSGTCSNSPNNIQYYVEKRNRLHPMIEMLNEESTAMAAKFRSLSGNEQLLFTWLLHF